eukprot:UN14920
MMSLTFFETEKDVFDVLHKQTQFSSPLRVSSTFKITIIRPKKWLVKKLDLNMRND